MSLPRMGMCIGTEISPAAIGTVALVEQGAASHGRSHGWVLVQSASLGARELRNAHIAISLTAPSLLPPHRLRDSPSIPLDVTLRNGCLQDLPPPVAMPPR